MKSLQSYVLVFSQDSDHLQGLEFLMTQLRCTWVIAHSAAQAIAKISQAPPYLIILAGNQQSWSKSLVNEFRRRSDVGKTTIVALTDSHAPSWLHQEENPGLDGFLVKPLNGDVFISVVQSAWARQTCETANHVCGMSSSTLGCNPSNVVSHAYSSRSEA
jgi:AmiR/NasT family two-component response regulator